ncbi:MAG: 3-hydroxyacyl-CoA dehydrogenase/enoyl-CoA hydratase family protein [Candidatus Melainabacteria bacterium]|nr:3-hydroxyacyl-CoA dehydrogenase/enoyl-CoA hydratase family protein [Candidatus Melainabacteria bacterium]
MTQNFVASCLAHGVAVLGAGNMGAGIAQKIAQEGIPVFLCDCTYELANKGKDKIALLLAEGVDKRLFDTAEMERILARITPTDELQVVKEVALVIEAVFEDMAVKEKLFSELHQICVPHTIFTTNTSSLSVEQLGRVSGRPQEFAGIHFFYHPAKNKLLEVIAAPGTSRQTERALWDFARAIKKIAIKTADSAGFAVNRFFVPWLNEAVRLYAEGIANIATIEDTAKDTFKIAMGPFELMNVTGIPIALHAATSLGRTFGQFYEAAPLLAEQVDSGKLWLLDGSIEAAKRDEVQERLLGCVFLIATTLVDEGVASREDTDRGATVGLRWAEGPFQMMNRLGTSKACELVEKFIARYPYLSFPHSLKQVASKNTAWALSYLDMTIQDGVARIAFNRPEAMNALNPRVAGELRWRFEEAEANPKVEAIVFDGIGKAFVAGADIRFFVEALERNDFSQIYEFTAEGQDLFKRIAQSGKPTVALVNGIAYGGGAELALACQKIVVGPMAQFAFPETGIGIYPGLGGTQRVPRKIGRELARHLVFTGQSLGASDALAVGLADAVVSDSECTMLDDLERAHLAVTRARDSQPHTTHLPGWAEVAIILFSDQNVAETLAGKMPVSLNPELHATAEKILKTLSYKAPVALRIAARLINDGASMSLDEGLALELACLKEIFSTEDAYEGLSSLGKRRPVYKGK